MFRRARLLPALAMPCSEPRRPLAPRTKFIVELQIASFRSGSALYSRPTWGRDRNLDTILRSRRSHDRNPMPVSSQARCEPKNCQSARLLASGNGLSMYSIGGRFHSRTIISSTSRTENRRGSCGPKFQAFANLAPSVDARPASSIRQPCANASTCCHGRVASEPQGQTGIVHNRTNEIGNETILGPVSTTDNVSATSGRDEGICSQIGRIRSRITLDDHFGRTLGSAVGILAAERIVLPIGPRPLVILIYLVGRDADHGPDA